MTDEIERKRKTERERNRKNGENGSRKKGETERKGENINLINQQGISDNGKQLVFET